MRRVAVYTGSRADAGPLASVVRGLGDAAAVIETAGLYGHEGPLMARLGELKPDILVILGDRYESLICASAAALLGIPIAHVHGGDETEGAVDNQFRHAITKLAYWHFPSCEMHGRRIAQMGEDAERVFPVGAPGLDALAEPPLEALGIELTHPLALVCYHPETLSYRSVEEEFQSLADLLVCAGLSTIVISGANADPGGDYINGRWPSFAAGGNIVFRHTYGQRLWTSLMHHADYLIGNSSGFVIEGMTLRRMRGNAPEIVLVGDRQKGRHEEALTLFGSSEYPFGRPGGIGQSIADKLMSLEIPVKPRKRIAPCH